MPIYEYQCGECAHSMEAIQKMSDPVLVECPVCHKPSLKKCVTAPSFRLAGGGWYETDFKTGNKKNLAGDGAAKESGGPAAESKTSGGSAAESKGSGGKSDKQPAA